MPSTGGVLSTSDVVQDQITWKENAKFLYSFLNVYNLEWPSLTVQWLRTARRDNIRTAQFLLGTHANEKRLNYLHMFEVALPETDIVSMEHRDFDKHSDHSGFAYDSVVSAYKYKMIMKIPTPSGEIHKARCSEVQLEHEGDIKLGAAMTAGGDLVLFDATLPDEMGPSTDESCVKAHLIGHPVSGWGLSWSHFDKNHLVSCSDDGTICTWDVDANSSPPPISSQNKARRISSSRKMVKGTSSDADKSTVSEIYPVRVFQNIGHKAPPQAVISDKSNPSLFISAGDDGQVFVWDIRIPAKEHCCYPVCGTNVKNSSFNNVDQSIHRPYLLATAGSDSDVCLWDTRMCGFPVSRLSAHQKMVNAVLFNPTYEYLVGSASADSTLKIWDLRDIGKEQSQEMAADGPPELLFSHNGHPAGIQDFDFAGTKGDLLVSSVCDANQWHIWRMDKSVFMRDDLDESDEEEYLEDNFPVE